MRIAFTEPMMNAQILTKTIAPSGHTAQSIHGPQPGSNPARIQETRQDTSDTAPKTVASVGNTQDGKPEMSANPNDFKQALTERMAESEPEQDSVESLTESPNATATALQVTMTQGQAPPQAITQPSGPLDQSRQEAPAPPTPDVNAAPVPDMRATEQPEKKMQLPESGFKAPSGEKSGIEALERLPGVTPKEATDPHASASQTSPLPTSPPASVTAPTRAPEFASAPSTEVVESPGVPVTQHATVTVTEPVPQTATQTEESSPAQGQSPRSAQPVSTKVAATDMVPTQPAAPESAQPETVSVTSETKPAPAIDIQSILKTTPRNVKSEGAPPSTPPVEGVPQTDTSEPTQVTRAVQQAVTPMLEPSQAQPATASEPPAPLETDPSTISALTVPETHGTQDASEVTLPRSLGPTSNPLPRQIHDSIALGVQQNSRQIVIRLDPPELGRVALRFQEDSQGITGVLEVQKSQTRHDIQHALPEIIQQLQENGVPIKRVEVLLSADGDSETFEDQAFAQARDQDLERQENSEQNDARRNPAYTWPSSHEESVQQRAQDQYASDQGINLLI